jgi:hypothetical protein
MTVINGDVKKVSAAAHMGDQIVLDADSSGGRAN